MNEQTQHRRTAFEGRLLKVEILDVLLDSGVESVREIVRHPGAAVILPELPDGRFVFVRQFRKPVEDDVLEAVAGTLEPGEDPEDCARRELREETGYPARSLRKLGAIVSAPGYTDERLHIFHALVGPSPDSLATDIDEHVDPVILTPAAFEDLVAQGQVIDAKTLAAWQLLARQPTPVKEASPDGS